MDAIRNLRTLRSVRAYEPTPIPDGILHDILEAGRWTGTAANRQQWRMLVIRDPQTLAALGEIRLDVQSRSAGAAPGDVCARCAGTLDDARRPLCLRCQASYARATAPLAIVPYMEGRAGAIDQLDLGRLTERLMLAAHAHDVASCIAGFGPGEGKSRSYALLGFPESVEVPYAITFGYPAAGQPPLASVAGKGRKPLAELVRHERYEERA